MNLKMILAAGVVLLSGALYAQTPDGETPAAEDVCDSLYGAAYGLCNAYCEDMDCDSVTTPQASANACVKVFDRFTQITGGVLPCEVSCPCATHQLWIDVLGDAELICGDSPWLDDGGHYFAYSFAVGDNGGAIFTGDDHLGPYCSALSLNGESGEDISVEELAACDNLILKVASGYGTQCDSQFPY